MCQYVCYICTTHLGVSIMAQSAQSVHNLLPRVADVQGSQCQRHTPACGGITILQQVLQHSAGHAGAQRLSHGYQRQAQHC